MVGSYKGATQRTRKFAAFGTGSESKDKIENETKRLVCSGKMTLSDAQKRIDSDWRKLGTDDDHSISKCQRSGCPNYFRMGSQESKYCSTECANHASTRMRRGRKS